MNFEELKSQSNLKVLFRAKSGYGKTRNACVIALNVSRSGRKVLYLDTEQEGSTTMVNLIESDDTDFEKEDVENIEYVQVSSFDEYMSYIDPEEGYHDDYALIVVDPIDHKHTYALRKVVEQQDAQSADWNEYSRIYDAEKSMMEKLQKPRTNILATLDPQSGKSEKPKGAQTNVVGYFGIVVDMTKDGEGWGNKVRNYVGRSEAIGNEIGNLTEHLTEEIIERSDDA